MAVQQLTQPIVNPISAFDATRAHNITFTVIGGAQVVANRLVISNNETGAIVYNKTAITMKLEHTIPANTLTNGGYYNAVVYTIDNANNESVASTAVPFYCYSQPVLTIDNIPATETIENGTYTFTGTYIQQEGEILNSYQYTLYDSNKNVLSKTPLIYYETDSSLSYTFVGMSNDTSYYIELSGETVNGTHITSGVIYFTVRYIQPASFAICDLVNNCDDGYIQVSSNIVAIDGKSNPDPPIYIDDKEVDLREPDSWVEWDSGFRIQDDFTLRAWGRDFNPYEPIITLKNDIDTPQTPNKIEMKWMTGDVIKNLPLYTSKSGNNINIIDSEAANIQNLTVGGNSVEDKDNITKLVIDGNSEQETTEGKNKFNLNYIEQSSAKVVTDTGVNLTNCWETQAFNNEKVLKTFKPNTTYTMKAKAKVVSRPSTIPVYNHNNVLLLYRPSSNTLEAVGISVIEMPNKNTIGLNTETTCITTFTTPADLTNIKLISYTFHGNNDGSTTYAPSGKIDLTDIMLVEGTYTMDNFPSYEPYTGGIPSPNPDYPQEIEVIEGYNLFDNNKVTSMVKLSYSNGIYTASDKDTKENLQYKIQQYNSSDKFVSGTSVMLNIDSTGTYYFTSKKKDGATRLKIANNGDKNEFTLKYPLDNIKVGEYFTVSMNIIDITVGSSKFKDVMLVKGATIRPYLPYGNIGLKQTGKNIFDKSAVTKGYEFSGQSGRAVVNPNWYVSDYIEVNKLSKIYLSSTGKTSGEANCFYDKDKNFIGFQVGVNNVSLSVPENAYYLRINGLITQLDNDIQIEKGTEETPYEPYHEPKIIPIDLQGNILSKIGDVKDILRVNRNGEVEIEKKVGKIVLDGSENWFIGTELTKTCSFGLTVDNKTNGAGLCNSFITKDSGISSIDEEFVQTNHLNKNIYIRINKERLTSKDVQGFKTFLSSSKEAGTPVVVYYKLATPQTITLPSISPIELWQGTNIFEPITNLSTTLETTYGYSSVGDIKNIINVSDFNITYNQAYYQDTNTNFKLQPNYLYTLSFDYNINSESTDLYFSIGYGTDSYKTNIASSIQYKTQNKGRNTISFIVPEKVSENDALWVRFAQTIILANVNVDISNIQLEYGKKATDYQTPGLYNIYLTSAAKNLYNYETPLYLQKNNVSYIEIQGGYEITPVIVDTPASLNIGWKSLLNPGDTYTVSYSQLGQFEDFKLYKTDKNSQKIISEIPLNNNTFVAPDGFYDLQLVFSVDSSSTTNHIDIWNIQIEASNVITTYDPYISNSSIITLEEPLRSSGEYRDLICLASPNLLNPANQSANVSGDEKYYLSQAGNVLYTLDFINEDNNKISSIVLTSGVFTTPDNCVKVQIENVEATDLTNNKVQINIGEIARVYYPYVTVPSLIRYCKEENGVISVLDTPAAYDLSTDNQSALEVLTTYTPISNVFTNNTVLGQLYLDYVSGYSNQQTENAYVLLKCWNANKMPYVIHSNYIDIPSDYNKVFIWCRRKGNLFNLKIEDLGDYREHDKPIDTDKPVVELVVDKTGVTRTEIPVTATSIDNVGLRTVRFSKDNGATWDEIVPVDGLSSVNSYTFTGLTPDTTYTIRAEAIDLSGNIGGISENATTLA